MSAHKQHSACRSFDSGVSASTGYVLCQIARLWAAQTWLCSVPSIWTCGRSGSLTQSMYETNTSGQSSWNCETYDDIPMILQGIPLFINVYFGQHLIFVDLSWFITAKRASERPWHCNEWFFTDGPMLWSQDAAELPKKKHTFWRQIPNLWINPNCGWYAKKWRYY